MSTTTFTYESTPDPVDMAHLRAIEAEARAEARRLAKLERQREEQERQRIERAQALIAEQENIFVDAVARLDVAASRLPDLMLTAPKLPSMDESIAGNVEQVEAHASELKSIIERFGRQLDDAIKRAEYLLERRIEKAKAWRRAIDLANQHAWLTDACRNLASRTGGSFTTIALPQRPGSDAELEKVLEHEQELRIDVEALNRSYVALSTRMAGQARAASLAGPAVATRHADVCLEQQEVERRDAARTALIAYRDQQLREAGLTLQELSAAVCRQIDAALDEAHLQDQLFRLDQWILAEKQRLDGVKRATILLQGVPQLVQEDPRLARRWCALATRLQTISSGLEAFEPEVDHEYDQLQRDAQLLRNSMFAKADMVCRMRQAGFEVSQRPGGEEMLLLDPRHPEIWLKVKTNRSETGGVGAIVEMMTDSEHSNEAVVIEDICSRLSQASSKTRPNITVQASEVERNSKIKRGVRPSHKKAMHFRPKRPDT